MCDTHLTLFCSHHNANCLAHVINLGTQMLIGTYSKSPHYDLTKPVAHVPICCDEVGVIRAIVVKVYALP